MLVIFQLVMTQMAELLSLDPDQRIVMLIALGYPDPQGLVPFSQKASIDEIRKYNQMT